MIDADPKGRDMLAKPGEAGLVYAATRDGYALPVIDVTHPRFHVADDADAQRRLKEALVKSDRQRRLIPKFVMRWMLQSAARKSRLVNALFGTDATFLDGITTYVMKLGAVNLVPPYDTPIDRKFAASPHVTYLRLRTQQMAELMAEGLVPHLVSNDKPLAIINIAGGPTVDTINALILLAKRVPALPRRKITIHVLDQDDAGPFFGRNALAAMQADDGPLAGHDITFDHRAYDWNDTTLLSDLIAKLANGDAIIAASSEGGLFEYGSDHAIIENLKVLNSKRHGVRLVVGSVTRDDDLRQRMMQQSRIQLIPRGIKGFRPLAAQAGFAIIEIRPTIWSDQVLMVP
jgi:hypothetical protein